MRLVKQTNEFDCGVAVAAMLGGVTITRARYVDPTPDALRGLHVDELVGMLDELTGQRWKVSKRHYGKPLIELALPESEAALLIRIPGDRWGHWVATDGRRIYDPATAAATSPVLTEKRYWSVIRVVLPAG